MSNYTTSLGNDVHHCHVPGAQPCGNHDFTLAQIKHWRKWLKNHFPLATEIEPPTLRYNCFGYALAYAFGWFGQFSTDPVELLINDDFSEIDESEVQPEDIVIYRKDGDPTHAAIINRVENGKITETRGKFGKSSLALYPHLNLPHPAKYGSPAQFLRRLPRAEHVPGFGALEMKRKNLSDFDAALTLLSDPEVNLAVGLASVPSVARDIIESLPGVKELREGGPEAARAVLTLLQLESTLDDDNLSAILLYILHRYPSEEVKLALAKQISAFRFTLINAQLAAEAFLKAARIDFAPQDAITLAFQEARKLYPGNDSEVIGDEDHEC